MYGCDDQLYIYIFLIFSIIVYILYPLRVYYELEMGPENCAGIAEFMGSNPVHAWFCFLQALISQLLVCTTGMINHKFIFFSAVQIYDLSFIHLLKKNSVNLSKLSLFFSWNVLLSLAFLPGIFILILIFAIDLFLSMFRY